MSFAAIIPVASMAAANTALEDAAYGPDSFSIPLYTTGTQPTYAGLHAWNDAALQAACEAIDGVQISTIAGTPSERFEDCIVKASCQWGSSAPPLTGVVTPGLYRHNDELWLVIQQYDTATWPDPSAPGLTALVRRARVPGEVAPWVQPLDQFDAYKLLNPFTGLADRVSHEGQTWFVSQADGAGINVFEPGVWGWTIEGQEPVNEPEPGGVEGWVQPTGAHDAYTLGAIVTHNGLTWENTGSDANVWEPGVFGWTQV